MIVLCTFMSLLRMIWDCVVIVVSARHPLGPTNRALFLATVSFFLAARCAERLPCENKE